MKYIVVSHKDQEQIFTFPKNIDHYHMMEAIGAVRVGRGNHWEREYRKATAIAAGFIDNGLCHGKSESLNLISRGAKDTALLSLPAPAQTPSSGPALGSDNPLPEERSGAPKM